MSDGPLFERMGNAEQSGGDAPDVWSVAALNRSVRLTLESGWGGLWVEGEIADVTRAATGHVYFTLCDREETAQLRAVMFRSDARRSRAKLEKGACVRVYGSLSLYEPRGSFQLMVRRAVPAGAGALAAQLRRLIKKLEAEGLTAPERKRPLPLLPRTVGVVTSAHGAAIHDILRVSRRRCPARLVLAPCRVQGAEAPVEIVRALRTLQRLAHLDVIIVARGGGSAEDLWAFNDERVARAVAAARVPVVSGVGHETDVSVVDLVADVRAATPSNAAELVFPEGEALREKLASLERSLARALEVHVGRARMRLGELERRLSDPRHTLRGHAQRLDWLRRRLQSAVRDRVRAPRTELDELRRRLAPLAPQARLRAQRAMLSELSTRLTRTPGRWLVPRRAAVAALAERTRQAGPVHTARNRRRLSELAAALTALSPLSVLSRGYAIVFQRASGKALRRATEARVGERLRIRLHEGEVQAEVVDDD